MNLNLIVIVICVYILVGDWLYNSFFDVKDDTRNFFVFLFFWPIYIVIPIISIVILFIISLIRKIFRL